MGFSQYHEPANELPQEVRTFARVITSLQEECEAIGWYEQRIAVEQDPEARQILLHAQSEECLHFSIDLEFLLRRHALWRVAAQHVLFQSGDIIAHAKQGEEAQEHLES